MGKKKSKPRRSRSKPMKRCGLCGKWKKLTRTECCGNWICDDAHNYVMFSYERNSCYRNHHRFTLCAVHHAEQHKGNWKTCEKCKEHVPTEMYVWYGTNEYNFEVLENPPKYDPTRCTKCNRIIRLAEEGYMISGGGYLCEDCSDVEIPDFL